jgi:hypothetical protein
VPTYKRFEDLPVWQAAADLYEKCDDFLEHTPPRLSESPEHPFRKQWEQQHGPLR